MISFGLTASSPEDIARRQPNLRKAISHSRVHTKIFQQYHLLMTTDQFRASLTQSGPPANLPPLVAALWWDAKGDWKQAHEIAQAEESADAAWVHAHLHRKEGDAANAAYWYGQARRPHSKLALEAEWEQIATALLGTL